MHIAGGHILSKFGSDGQLVKRVWECLSDDESYVRASAVNTLDHWMKSPDGAKLIWNELNQVSAFLFNSSRSIFQVWLSVLQEQLKSLLL